MPNGNDNFYEPTETPTSSYDSVARVADVERWHSTVAHTGIPGVGDALSWTDAISGNVYAITFDNSKLLITVTSDEDVLLGRIQFSNSGTAIASFDADGEVRSTIVTTNGGSVQIETFDAELNNTGTISSEAGEVRIAGPGYATDLLLTATAVVLTGLPTADPSAAGALWIDVAAGRVIKVSAG
jgi:hypothetical protein